MDRTMNEGRLSSLERASVLAASDDPKDQDKAREIKTRFDYESLKRQIGSKKKPSKPAVNETTMPNVSSNDKKAIKSRAKNLFKRDLKGEHDGVNEAVGAGVPLTPQELEIQKKMSRLNVRLARKRNQEMQKAKTKDTETAPEQVKEGSLHKWFKGSKSKDGKPGWVNVKTGGTCASDEPGEGTPKCVSSAKRASMTKAERDSASRRKKAADPNQQQKSGAAKPTYVRTDAKKKMNEAKVDKGRSDYGKASIRNYRRMGPGHGEPAMFDPENKRGKLIDKRREEHKARRGVKKAKVPAYKVDEGLGATYAIGGVSNAIASVAKAYGASQAAKGAIIGGALSGGGAVVGGALNYAASRNKKKADVKPKQTQKKMKEEVELDERLGGKGYKPYTSLTGKKVSGDWEDSDRGAGNKAKKRAGGKVEKKSPTYMAHVLNKEEVVTEADKKGKGSGTKDACYHKVKASAKVWPSAYASGRLVQCRKKGASNYGKSKSEGFENWTSDPILEKVAAWQRKEGKSKSGGLNEKGRKSYEKENPGSDLKAPQPEGGSRKKSFCARMGGMKKKLTSKKTANDPDSRINKALRKWNCSYEPEGTPIMEEDKALKFVIDKYRKKYGKDAVLTKDSPKPKPPSEAQKKKAAAERKKRQDADNKAYASRAKKAGFKSTQDYTNVVARYGSEDNYRKGKGLGT